MFSAFFNRQPRAKRDPDCVWMTREAKLRAVVAASGARVVVHFSETRRALQALARQRGSPLEVALATGLPNLPSRDPELRVLVAERHPLREHDERIAAWADATAGRIVFHLALDEAPLSLFAGDGLRSVLDKLGASADEPLVNAMVSRSIERAQQRVKKKATGDLPADSAAGWMRANGFGELAEVAQLDPAERVFSGSVDV